MSYSAVTKPLFGHLRALHFSTNANKGCEKTWNNIYSSEIVFNLHLFPLFYKSMFSEVSRIHDRQLALKDHI